MSDITISLTPQEVLHLTTIVGNSTSTDINDAIYDKLLAARRTIKHVQWDTLHGVCIAKHGTRVVIQTPSGSYECFDVDSHEEEYWDKSAAEDWLVMP